MKNLFFLFLFIGLISSSLFAQKGESVIQDDEGLSKEIREEQNQSLEKAVLNAKSSTVLINQIGKNNEAVILQSQYYSGNNNYVEVNQNGNSHDIYLDISGIGNGISITQSGDDGGHQYTGNISGNENLLNIQQSGSKNMIFQTATVDNLNMDIQQTGVENELNIINNTVTTMPLSIEQSGHSMKITIENNSVIPMSGGK